MLDVLIIGSGPAGLSAAIYAKRANLSCAVVEKNYLGTGQIAESSKVDNYLGLPGISGYDLGKKFREHAESFSVDFIENEVIEISQKENTGTWTTILNSAGDIESKTIIFAAGCVYRKLGIESEDKYTGCGISYCAVCDGPFYRGKEAAVIGGGDTALDDALYLSDICSKVYLIHRRDEFRGSQATLSKIKKRENIEIVTNSFVTDINGEKRVEKIVLNTGKEIKTDGIFLAIGMVPNTEILKGLNVLDKNGYVIADEECTTSISGLFVAGDAREKKFRQIVTAVSDGANSVNSVIEYLKVIY